MGILSLFKKDKAAMELTYDKENETPVIRCSICTGEKVAGFKNVRTGKFTDVMLIRNDSDVELFKEQYGLDTIAKEY